MGFSLFGILTLIGSLGFFLFGMKIMSDGIQKVAGDKMRQILEAMTRNRVAGILTGFLITSLVQSSSATTVMVVSFVNAGLLNLVEAIGVIMGANIGTTITAWIISLLGFKIKMSALSLPLIAIGFPLFFFKKDRIRSTGEVLVGFALLFLGLDFLKDSVPDLKSNPEALSFLSNLSDGGFGSILLFVVIGTLLTIILQSSSAAMALTLVMVNEGWIPYEAAAAIVLGENIGTTITANLAALVANVHAKRAAFAHTCFNLLGITWMLIIFYPFSEFVAVYLTPLVTEGLESLGTSPFENNDSITVSLSLFHTAFNIINTLLLIWLINPLAKFVEKVIRSKGASDEKFTLAYINSGIVNTSEIGILEARKEINRYADITIRMYGMVNELLQEQDKKQQAYLLERIEKYENIIDRIEIEIAQFLTRSAEDEVSEDTSRKIRAMLRINNNLEKIGDVCYHMSKTIQKKNSEKAWLNPVQRQNLTEILGLVGKGFDVMKENLDLQEKANFEKAVEVEISINELRNKIREDHFVSIEKGEYNIRSGLYYNNLYSSYEKIGDHLMNISEAVTGKQTE